MTHSEDTSQTFGHPPVHPVGSRSTVVTSERINWGNGLPLSSMVALCATWRTEDADEDGYWALATCNESRPLRLVHHDGVLAAAVLLGEMLGVDWEDE